VSSAAQALQAMAQAHEAQRPFEVALIDHHMPEGDGAELGQRISNDARYAATRLVMLTSASQLGDIQKFTQLGFAGYLLKPVTQNDLMQCLMLALSVPAEQWQLQTQPIVTRDVLHAQRAYSQSRVLLAEDNVVNQKVTSRIVEKLGFRVDIVASGVEAVAAWSTGHYDLILMDCQMPIMDGYDATREIRKLEREPRHIPIVALTAHAMKGADEQCRLAGMDDYLTKPIDRAVLETVLKRYLSDAPLQDNATNMKSAAVSSASADDPPVDWEALIEATDQDGDLIRELTTLFIGSSDVGVAAIARAIATADFDAVRRKAHEIKGVSANMHAQKLSSTAAQIEEAIEAGEYGHVATLADELRREMARTVDYLRAKTA
jgi:CheY-like chemotaxis protein/HPt (histidine-containing phosphotransfer) domain-containing protein